MNLSVQQKKNHTHRGHMMVAKGEAAGKMEWEAGVRRCKLLYTE